MQEIYSGGKWPLGLEVSTDSDLVKHKRKLQQNQSEKTQKEQKKERFSWFRLLFVEDKFTAQRRMRERCRCDKKKQKQKEKTTKPYAVSKEWRKAGRVEKKTENIKALCESKMRRDLKRVWLSRSGCRHKAEGEVRNEPQSGWMT